MDRKDEVMSTKEYYATLLEMLTTVWKKLELLNLY